MQLMCGHDNEKTLNYTNILNLGHADNQQVKITSTLQKW